MEPTNTSEQTGLQTAFDTGNGALLSQAAVYILQRYAGDLPDLSRIAVITPNDTSARQFELTLCHALQQDSAIIPPWCGTLESWCLANIPSPLPEYQLVNEFARQCLFVDALQQNRHLFKEENQWQITLSLLQLFDELNLNPTGLFSDENAFRTNLLSAYGIDTDVSGSDDLLSHLNAESKLVYTLWHAWNQQLTDHQCHDSVRDYASRLLHLIDNPDQPDIHKSLIYIGDPPLAELERRLLCSLQAAGRCTVFSMDTCSVTAGITDTGHSYRDDKGSEYRDHARAFFCQALMPTAETEPSGAVSKPPEADDTLPIKVRAEQFRASLGDDHTPVPFAVYLSQDEEDQVMAIDLYIRQQIIDGRRNIAVICEDRKLSRRLRAILERSNIEIRDQAGWSLATTQAVSVIERWLQCIEEDFNAFPLLSVLKSPFIDLAAITRHGDSAASGADISADIDNKNTREHLLKNIYRLEQDIILHENVSSNIGQYRQSMKDRLKRLEHWPRSSYAALDGILSGLHNIAAPLIELYDSDQRITLSEFIQHLIGSLQQLGVLRLYRDDAAGTIIIDTLQQLQAGLEQAAQQDASPKVDWNDCRNWLAMALETQHFSPPTNRQTLVRLMTLEQADYQVYDCLVIAACEPQHFPGSAEPLPVFNQSVRASLGLNTWEQLYQRRLRQFTRALQSTEQRLITACNMDKGEEKPVSPWLELLLRFYQLVYDESAVDQSLRRYTELHSRGPDAEPVSMQTRPASTLPAALLPKRISASAYQRLINCPYQFFAADGLGLKAQEEISIELRKSDYGQRVHRILQLFHTGRHAPCDAFSEIITTHNRQRAIAHLEQISEYIFRKEMTDNVLHRSWYYRWNKMIPAYIDWQMKQQQDWSVLKGEQQLDVPLSEQQQDVSVYGRLDRIDQRHADSRHLIIDYKTGNCPKQQDVDNGEDVQLATYAMLDRHADAVEYLSVDSSDQKVAVKSSLDGDDLELNRERNQIRLADMIEMIRQSDRLTAWGDEGVCQYCDFTGICRRHHWPDDNGSGDAGS
jgi:ATP-dependent helicase/nuclease subunit B